MSDQFRWGILGPGKIAHKFATSLAAIPDAQVYAIGSRAIERAEAFAQKYHAPKIFGSYEDLVRYQEVDAIYVATPHPYHMENALLCLEHGIPVLCEKPFAMNRKQVNHIIAAAEKHNTFLMEALWSRFLPAFLKNEGVGGRGTNW